MKPGGCNCSHILKALKHPTGLPNPQPSDECPAPGPQQAPAHTNQMPQWKKNTYIFQKEGGKGGITEDR